VDNQNVLDNLICLQAKIAAINAQNNALTNYIRIRNQMINHENLSQTSFTKPTIAILKP
jgi:hypothetical protein